MYGDNIPRDQREGGDKWLRSLNLNAEIVRNNTQRYPTFARFAKYSINIKEPSRA